jgi:hypothetical protein
MAYGLSGVGGNKLALLFVTFSGLVNELLIPLWRLMTETPLLKYGFN